MVIESIIIWCHPWSSRMWKSICGFSKGSMISGFCSWDPYCKLSKLVNVSTTIFWTWTSRSSLGKLAMGVIRFLIGTSMWQPLICGLGSCIASYPWIKHCTYAKLVTSFELQISKSTMVPSLFHNPHIIKAFKIMCYYLKLRNSKLNGISGGSPY
jgi:hypothetical protein